MECLRTGVVNSYETHTGSLWPRRVGAGAPHFLSGSVIYSVIAVMPGMRFTTLRLINPSLLPASQVYLFLSVPNTILSSVISDRYKSGAVGLAGATIGLLFAMNAYILAKPLWVNPPIVARTLLCYLPVVGPSALSSQNLPPGGIPCMSSEK